MHMYRLVGMYIYVYVYVYVYIYIYINIYKYIYLVPGPRSASYMLNTRNEEGLGIIHYFRLGDLLRVVPSQKQRNTARTLAHAQTILYK